MGCTQTLYIGEFSVIGTEYVEVQEIDKVSYRSMHTVIKLGKKWLPVTAQVIPCVTVYNLCSWV